MKNQIIGKEILRNLNNTRIEKLEPTVEQALLNLMLKSDRNKTEKSKEDFLYCTKQE